jgi:predicted transcriptional regulator
VFIPVHRDTRKTLDAIARELGVTEAVVAALLLSAAARAVAERSSRGTSEQAGEVHDA